MKKALMLALIFLCLALSVSEGFAATKGFTKIIGKLSGQPYAVASYDGLLWLGASALDINGIGADWFAIYSPNWATWSVNRGSLNAIVNAFYVDSDTNTLYIAGNFTDGNGITSADAAVTYGGGTSTWKTLGNFSGGGLQNAPKVITKYRGEIYYGGNMKDINGQTDCNKIARFNGTTWTCMGANVGFTKGTATNTSVLSFAVFNDQLWVGGDFKDWNGSKDFNNLAVWDGDTNSWKKITNVGASVNGMAVYDGNLYLAGAFQDLNGVLCADRIARYDGNDFHGVGCANPASHATAINLGSGGGGPLQVYNNKLWIGCTSTGVDLNGIKDANKIIAWNGMTFESIGALNAHVHVLSTYNNYLAIGGDFTDANKITDANRLILYNDYSNFAPTLVVVAPNGDGNYLINDTNAGITFTVQDSDNDELHAKISYSITAGLFSNSIIADLNLNNTGLTNLSCSSRTWTTTQTCTYSWAISGVADGNYFLDLNIWDTSNAQVIDSSNSSFNIITVTNFTYDFTVSLPASCTGGQGKSTAGNGVCDRCWVQPEDSLPPIDSSDLNCQGQNVGTLTPFLLFDFTGSAATYDLNMDLNAVPPAGLTALVKCDSGDSTGAVTLSASPQVVCNDIAGDHNIFMWLKFTNYSVANGLFSVRGADVNASA